MKHSLIIILSLILLSSPVIGEETGILYLYEGSSGILWKEFGDKETNPIYKGDIENGKPNGVGVSGVSSHVDVSWWVGGNTKA